MRRPRHLFQRHGSCGLAACVCIATLAMIGPVAAQVTAQDAATMSPPGMKAVLPPTFELRVESAEPMSPRAAAAADRAARALAGEEGSEFDGGAPAEADLIAAEQPVAVAAPVAAAGQPVTDATRRRSSAAVAQPPPAPTAAKANTTCIAGCY